MSALPGSALGPGPAREDFPIYRHVLFDFDGTLIDSAPGIQSSLQRALAASGHALNGDFAALPIGPPLRELVVAALGPMPADAYRAVEQAFREAYDAGGFRESEPYAGIETLLADLAAAGTAVHLVTNKRRIPTLQILAHLGWEGFFQSVWTLDSVPEARTKADVVRRLLDLHGIAPGDVLLVGDSVDDARGATANGIPFGWAAWGYGRDPSLSAAGLCFDAVTDLHAHVRGLPA